MTSRTHALLQRHAPDDPVVVGSDGIIDAATMLRRVHHTASQLSASDGAVLVSCADAASFMVAVLAAWYRGLPIALPPNTRPRTLSEIREVAPICTEITDGDARLAPGEDGSEDEPIVIESDRHVATVYTSGSTGPYQIVQKSASQLLGEAAVLVEAFGLDGSARVLSTVPPHHIYGLLFGVLVPSTCGGSLIGALPLHASTVEAVAREHAATVLVSTPAHLRGLEVLDPGAVPSLVRVFSSGAPLHPATASIVRERLGLGVTEILGSTETGGVAWRSAEGSDDPPWRPLPGIRVGVGADDRMMLWSPFLPKAVPLPFATQDRIALLEVDAQGGGETPFRHLGRLDDVVKVGGKRIALGVLEARLRSLPGVLDAAVLADEAVSGHDRRVRAAVVAPGVQPETLRSALLQWFDPVVVPRRIVVVEALPRENTGKLRRASLQRLLDGDRRSARSGRSDLVLRPLGPDLERERRFEVEVPPDLVYFEGHFPGQPVLSGAALLEAAGVRASVQSWPDLGRLRQVERLKFKQPIGPGDRLVVRLSRDDDRVAFEVHRGTDPCASALLVFSC
jgi:acyl-coenzyme A synthetase/AMP-(fatty) acid ligase